METGRGIQVHGKDNVAVAVENIPQGCVVCGVTAAEEIPAGHKVALRRIEADGAIVKYGYTVGTALAGIQPGQWVHVHNAGSGLDGELAYRYCPKFAVPGKKREAYFNGFLRKNGTAGIRNEIWIVPTVGCVNSTARTLERRAAEWIGGTVDAVVSFPHPYGCSQLGEDQENTRTVLADLVKHPNAGAVLVLGLGCENSGVEELKQYIGEYDADRVKFLVCQDSLDEIEDGLSVLRQLVSYAGGFAREKISVSKLTVGLKCGGSDGFSGITANPVVGSFTDHLVAAGGTALLTEVPEMFGAEQVLMERCASQEVFDRTVGLVNGFKRYFLENGQNVYENPSPGNKAGGITTLEEKSLGCVQKSGTARVEGVLAYGEQANRQGLHLLAAPGNDLVASTALAASGAQLLLFTTGRGTPFAAPVPTVKISSNQGLSARKQNWIDFDTGILLTGERSREELAEELFDFVLQTASGGKLKGEEAGFHDMAVWKQGVTL